MVSGLVCALAGVRMVDDVNKARAAGWFGAALAVAWWFAIGRILVRRP